MMVPSRRPGFISALGGGLCVLLAAPLAQPLAGQATPSVDRSEVERIVSTLASDEMRGREAFSEDAMRAAAFISEEFAAAGLEVFDGGDGYLQPFEVLAYSMGPGNAVIDGPAPLARSLPGALRRPVDRLVDG